MHHATPLISTIAIGLAVAYLLGMIFNQIKIPPIIGYLAAGIIVGPFTPGFAEVDTELTKELSELGVIFLMFGVGLHFSFKDIMSVKNIAVPGAFVQIIVATTLSLSLIYLLDLSLFAAIIFGICTAVGSTVVVLRTLEERQLIETRRGMISIGYLIIEDLIMILVLVLIPVITKMLDQDGPANFSQLAYEFGITIGKVVLFIVIMMVVGSRVIPWLIARSASTGSRELFTLSVLAIALGIAYASVQIFDVSFALGAFFSGMVLSESELSQRAGHDILPLRDAFAVLFFVSVGMLFDPIIIMEAPLAIFVTIVIVVIFKPLATYYFMRFLKKTKRVALTVAVSLAQVGEFSFILAGLAMSLGLFTEREHNIILIAAVISILISPILFKVMESYLKKIEDKAPTITVLPPDEELSEFNQQRVELANHVVVVGDGKLGEAVIEGLQLSDTAFVAIDNSRTVVENLLFRNINAILGDVKNTDILKLANVEQANLIIYTVPNVYEIADSIATARKLNPEIQIVSWAAHDDEVEYLLDHDANNVIYGVNEIANSMLNISAVIKERTVKTEMTKIGLMAPDPEEYSNI